MKTKKIIKVLEFIMEYCKNRNECKNCPFYESDEYECSFIKERCLYPTEWGIKNIKANLTDKEKIYADKETL